MIGLHFQETYYETCWSVTSHLNIPVFRTQKYGHFSIRASAYAPGTIHKICMLKINLSLKNATTNRIKYFLTFY